MWRYLRQHEQLVRQALEREAGPGGWDGLRAFHEKQIRYLQHERLVHLLVLLAVAVLALGSVVFVAVMPSGPGLALAALLLLLAAAYVVHYFRLENGVQRLYHLSNRLDLKALAIGFEERELPGAGEAPWRS